MKLTTDEFSSNVIRMAEKLAEQDGGITQDAEVPAVWWAIPSDPKSDRRYRVQIMQDADGSPRWSTCTCPHGLNKGGGDARCKHVAAVLMTIQAQADGEPVEKPALRLVEEDTM